MDRFVHECQKIGIFGGTFDPIHYGHLRIAETLHEVYALDRVHIIPTGTPPHRLKPQVSGQDRFNMVQQALTNTANYLVADPREVLRSGVCYTFDTLAELQGEYPHAQLVWLIGMDTFMGLMQWHRWEALFDNAHLAIAHRPGASAHIWYENLPQALKQQYDQRLVIQDTLPYQVLKGKISVLSTIPFEISATLLRGKVAQHESLHFLTPEPVINYINQHGLYQ